MGATLYHIFKNQILNIRNQYKSQEEQEIINQSLIYLQLSEQLKQLLDKLLKVDHNQRFGWNQLFKNGLIKQLFESILQEQIQYQGNRKKRITLSYQMNKDFFSAGPILTETLYNIISKENKVHQQLWKFFNAVLKRIQELQFYKQLVKF